MLTKLGGGGGGSSRKSVAPKQKETDDLQIRLAAVEVEGDGFKSILGQIQSEVQKLRNDGCASASARKAEHEELQKRLATLEVDTAELRNEVQNQALRNDLVKLQRDLTQQVEQVESLIVANRSAAIALNQKAKIHQDVMETARELIDCFISGYREPACGKHVANSLNKLSALQRAKKTVSCKNMSKSRWEEGITNKIEQLESQISAAATGVEQKTNLDQDFLETDNWNNKEPVIGKHIAKDLKKLPAPQGEIIIQSSGIDSKTDWEEGITHKVEQLESLIVNAAIGVDQKASIHQNGLETVILTNQEPALEKFPSNQLKKSLAPQRGKMTQSLNNTSKNDFEVDINVFVDNALTGGLLAKVKIPADSTFKALRLAAEQITSKSLQITVGGAVLDEDLTLPVSGINNNDHVRAVIVPGLRPIVGEIQG